MGLFSKFFRKTTSKENITKTERGKYMPEIKLPIDEMFTVNFNANGGKFLYCENTNEVLDSFDSILKENNWQNEKILIINDQLTKVFKFIAINTTKTISEATYFLTTCEYLIALDGSILISSNQIAEKKLDELPDNFIIYATTSQFVENIGEGLRGIKQNNKTKIPTNITTLKHFKSKEAQNFLTYGISTKNLYLLLLEDL